MFSLRNRHPVVNLQNIFSFLFLFVIFKDHVQFRIKTFCNCMNSGLLSPTLHLHQMWLAALVTSLHRWWSAFFYYSRLVLGNIMTLTMSWVEMIVVYEIAVSHNRMARSCGNRTGNFDFDFFSPQIIKKLGWTGL